MGLFAGRFCEARSEPYPWMASRGSLRPVPRVFTFL
jgi:hypothetical protein